MKLTAKTEPFDSFWEAPENIEKGYGRFYKFYKDNYLKYVPERRDSQVLVVSCGPGYFVELLTKHGFDNVLGIDSDGGKIEYAKKRNLNCKTASAYDYLESNKDAFDVIIAEQEINHLTKDEIFLFLKLFRESLKQNGTLIIHSLNGANPITGAEALAQNVDHFNSFTEYSIRQVLEYSEFKEIKVIPLNLYVFYNNPFNYIAMILSAINNLVFKINFKLYGKANKLFTKKIAAICKKAG